MKIKRLLPKPETPLLPTKRSIEKYARAYAAWDDQQRTALRLLVYFNKLYQRKRNDPVVYIPLSRLNESVTAKHRHLVTFTAGIWFNRAHRGNGLTGKVSAWTPAPYPSLNVQMQRLVKSLTEQNAEAVQEMWTVMGQKHTVEITIRTVVKFENDEQAKLFGELLKMENKT